MVSPAIYSQVKALWLVATSVIVIGYQFGINLGHDSIWRDLFIETMRENCTAQIHAVLPNPTPVVETLKDGLDSTFRVHSHPLFWQQFANALLNLRSYGVPLSDMIAYPKELTKKYEYQLENSYA